MTDPVRAALELPGEPWLRALIAGAATAMAAGLLLRHARALGLLDTGGGAGLHRGGTRTPVALVGGLALALGLAAAELLRPAGGVWHVAPGLARPAWAAAALFAALGIGLADDLSHGGHGARAKLALQCLPALALALGAEAAAPWAGPAVFLAAVLAQNLANTYDHADGVVLSTAALALAPSRPAWAACALVLLAFNLRRRSRAPLLLGDGGSHLIAFLLLCEPRAWGAFLLPALDLARVVAVRRRAGRPWWSGDRAHLAHRLQAGGFSPPGAALSLAAAALPAILASHRAETVLEWSLGLGASALAFAFLVRATPAVDGLGAPSS